MSNRVEPAAARAGPQPSTVVGQVCRPAEVTRPAEAAQPELDELRARLGNRAVAEIIAGLTGTARPLEVPLRAEFERRLGHDLSGVRLHTGPQAQQAARAVGALAFTVGSDVVLGAGQDTSSLPGRRVLLHELAHVVQQQEVSSGQIALGDNADASEREADRIADWADVDDVRAHIRSGSRPGRPPGRQIARRPAVLRRKPDPDAKSAQPVVLSLSESQAVTAVTNWLGKAYNIKPDRAGVIVFRGRTMRLYRAARQVGVVRLTTTAYPLGPGVYSSGDRTSGGQRQVLQLYHEQRDYWTPIGRPKDSDPLLGNVIDDPVPEDKTAYSSFRDSVDDITWIVLAAKTGGSAQTAGGDGGDASGAGDGEPAPPMPAWATRIDTLLQTRLRSEQLRLAALAKDTIGDVRPETLRRLWAAEGVPKRISLGRSGDTPAEQVVIDRAETIGTNARLKEASAAVRLAQQDDANVVWERILTAGRVLYAGKRDAGAAPGEQDPIGVLGEAKADADAVPPNQPAYPSAIRYYGPATGVTDVPLHFTMNLDWMVDGEFAVFGPMALRSYAWRFVRIQETSGDAVTEADRRAHRREAASAAWDRGFGDLGEDLAATTTSEVLQQAELIGVDTVVRGIGTPIKSFIALASQPNNEQVIRFDRPGVYLVTCVSSHGPVYATEKNPHPFVRAPSVAAYTLRVRSPKELAASTVAPRELDAARTKLAELTEQAAHAATDEQAGLRQQIQEQQAEIDRLVAQDRVDLPSLLRSQAQDVPRQIALVKRLIALESTYADPKTWTDFEARVLRVDLQLRHVSAAQELARLEAAQTQLAVQQRSLSEVTDLKDAGYHPQVAFVPDSDGRVLPVMMQLAERSDSTEAHQRWVLIDVSVSGHRDRYEGSSTRPGAAGRAAAIGKAFENFAGGVPYGRGEIAIRLPDVLLAQLDGLSVPARLRAHPDADARFWGRLESLATAAAIAGLIVTGPAATAIAIVGGVAGGAVAVHRMYKRYEGGYLELDLTTAMDVAAIVGAAASIAGPIAASVPAGSKFVRTADWVERGVEVYGYVQLGASFVMVPVSYVQRLKAIPKDASPGERAALSAEAFLEAANTTLQLAVGATQMIQHASSGRARGPGEPEPAVRAPGEAPSEVSPVPQEDKVGTTEQSRATDRPPAAEQRPAGRKPAAEQTPHEHAPGDTIERVDIEHGMVIMSSEGRSLSRRDAAELFTNAVRNTPNAEVALLRNVDSGDFVVVIGDDARVQLGEANPNWREILPERAKRGRWVLEEHSHAVDPTTGRTPERARWPSGGDGDFLIVVTEALRTGQVARGRIRVHAGADQQVSEYAYHPGAARPYEIDIALGDGTRYRKRYATIEDYLIDYATRTGESVPEVPDGFPGARRSRPVGESTTEPKPGAPKTGEPAADADVPGPARVPGDQRSGATEIAPPVPRNRRGELAAKQKAAQDAATSGDPARIAAANRELLALHEELVTGLDGTGFSSGQAAKMADAGLDVPQMRALRAFAGEGGPGLVDRLSPGALREVGQFAERIEPLLGDPVTLAALDRLREAGTTNPATIARQLRAVPDTQLPALLRVLADPFLQLKGLNAEHWQLLTDPDVVALIDTYGSAIWRSLYRGTARGRTQTVLKRLAERVAADPAGGEALVQAVLEARTPRAQEKVLDIPAPPRAPRQPRRPEIRSWPDDALWPGFVTDATTFVDTHPEWYASATSGENPPTRTQLIDRVATINQIRSLARRGQYDGLTRPQRVALHGEFVAYTRETGFTGDWQGIANQATGSVSESLFLPEGARQGVRLPHPVVEGKPRETTLPDHELPAAGRVVPGVRNFVEQKSNGLAELDVGLARQHRKDAQLDQPGIAAAPAETLPGFEAPAGGAVHLIEYTRTPDQATQALFYDVLLGPDSPLTAVKFGDQPWMTRATWAAQRGRPEPPLWTPNQASAASR